MLMRLRSVRQGTFVVGLCCGAAEAESRVYAGTSMVLWPRVEVSTRSLETSTTARRA